MIDIYVYHNLVAREGFSGEKARQENLALVLHLALSLNLNSF